MTSTKRANRPLIRSIWQTLKTAEKPQPVATGWDSLYAYAYILSLGASRSGETGKAPYLCELQPRAFLYLYKIAHSKSIVAKGDNFLHKRHHVAAARFCLKESQL